MRSEHSKRLIDLIQPNGLFPLLEFAYESESKSRPHCKFFLSKSQSLSMLFYVFADVIHCFILYPLGTNVKHFQYIIPDWDHTIIFMNIYTR